MLLNHPLEFEGGELYVHGQEKSVLSKRQGQINFFPSFMLHTVAELQEIANQVRGNPAYKKEDIMELDAWRDHKDRTKRNVFS